MKRHFYYLIDTFILLSTSLSILKAQTHPICQIQQYTVYNGLAQRKVTGIVQDPKGFIWLSTWNGLNKFDGYTFKNYKSYPGDGCTLTSNRLSSIAATQYSDIWCKSYDDRIYLFDSHREVFIDILQPFEEQQGTTFTVEDIYTLPKGISWIVCKQGAFRVDEHELQQETDSCIAFFSPRERNLPGDVVYDIRQDADGDEWVLTNGGIHIIGQKEWANGSIFTAMCESNDKIYLITNDRRMGIYDSRTGQLIFKSTPKACRRLFSIQHLGYNRVGIGTDNGILLYHTDNGQLEHIDVRTPEHPSSEALRMFSDSHGELWIYSTERGVTRYNPATDEKQHYETPQQNIPKAERHSRDLFFEDSQGTLWMVPHGGSLSYYDRNDKQLKAYYTKYNDPSSIFTPIILSHYTDKQKNFWYANNSGVGKISFFPPASQIVAFDSGFEIRAFLTDRDKNLWVANKKGTIRILDANNRLKGYLTPTGQISPRPVSFGKSAYCFMENKNGDIWIGTRWDGLVRLKKQTDGHYDVRYYVHHRNDSYSLSDNRIYSIFCDSRGRIWVGTYGGGLNLMDETPDGQVRFLHSGNRLKKFPSKKFSRVRIVREVGSAILVGTTEGLLTFSSDFERPEDIRFYVNTRRSDVANSLSSNDVLHIYTDSREVTYVLTFTGGINQITSEDLLTDHISFKTYTTKDGLLSDLVLSMIEDDQHNLWVVSENALAKFNPGTGTFDNYDEKYMQERLFISEAIPVLRNGKLLLGTDMGILCITPTLLKKSSYKPPIALTGLRIQGITHRLPTDAPTQLELKPNERNVSFEYAALDYVDSESINYSYRMKGLEEEWNEAGNSRRASYNNLPPGEYEFQVKSTNSDNVWTDNIKSLPIKVTPTFDETAWAIVLYVILFLLLTCATVLIINYIYRLRHRISLEQQLANIKLRFFTDISHELRTPLTLITNPVSEVLEHEELSPNARKYLTLVHKNTERMLHLVNQILDFRKIENQKMKLLLEQTDVISLLNRVMDNFRHIAEEKHIHFTLEATPESIYAWIDRDKVEKIVFNLVSNAFKYTPDHKNITISVQASNGILTISVADQGIGIESKQQKQLFQRFETLVKSNILQSSSGIGLSLTKELVELHQGSIEVNSQVGEGSQFTITLPMTREAYKDNKMAEIILNDGKTDKESRTTTSSLPSKEEIIQTDEGLVSILVVEDNEELRNFLCDILADSYQVITACNGQEGLERALSEVPDLIISDIMMPVMDGLDMVKAIKENADICHIPIILLSAKSSLDDRIRGLEQGIDDYITKPFSSSYLKARIRTLLQQRKALQQLYLQRWMEKQGKTDKADTAETGSPLPINSLDEEFMQQITEIVEKQLDNSEFTIEEFAKQLGMGRTLFYQKLKSLVGLSPVDFVREIRLKRAMQLLTEGQYNVSTVAYMSGFNDPKYFSKCFKKRFGKSPSDYCKDTTAETKS